MKKNFFLIIALFLYSISANANITSEDVSPVYIDVHEAWILLDDRSKTLPYSGTDKIYFDHNALLLKNYAEGYRDAVADNLPSKVSQKTKNCLTRPMKMFYDEIFDSYRKGEVSGLKLFSKVLKDKLAKCANSSNLEINFN